MVSSMVQSYQGPTDTALRSNAVEGYTQVSRIGESVINCFVDAYEFAAVPQTFHKEELEGDAFRKDNKVYAVADPNGQPISGTPVESKCHFYEWATAYVGMIAVQRKQRSTFRNHVAAETAAPVVVCAVGRGPLDEFDWQFAGVVRSNSVRTVDDGMGPTVDEYFTLTIAGPQTILNNGKDVIHPGDPLAWTFYSEDKKTASLERRKSGTPRRIGIRVATFHDDQVFGRALTIAKPGQ